MGDLNPAVDFLDILSDDIPKGKTTEFRHPQYNMSPVGFFLTNHSHTAVQETFSSIFIAKISLSGESDKQSSLRILHEFARV